MEPSKPFLPAPMLQAIGNLSAYWSYLESATEIAIWCFLGVPRHLGAAVTTHMGLVSRCQALRALAAYHFADLPEALSEFESLLSRIEGARVKRNAIIHAFWKHTVEGDRAPVLRISARGVFKQEENEISVGDIEAIIDTTTGLTGELQGCLEAVFPDAYLPWPRTSDEETPSE